MDLTPGKTRDLGSGGKLAISVEFLAFPIHIPEVYWTKETLILTTSKGVLNLS